MTDILEFPMMSDRSIVDLRDIVPAIAVGDLAWCFLEFSGVALPPNGMSMDEFEEAADSQGCMISEDDLETFAKNCNQTWDCWIVGQTAGNTDAQTREQWQENALIVIEGLDSDFWIVRSRLPYRLGRLKSLLASRSHPIRRSKDSSDGKG